MRLRILYLAPEITVPGYHGGSSHVLGAVRGFHELGHEVIAVVKWKFPQWFVSHETGITWVRVPVLPTGVLRNLCYFLWSFFLGLLSLLFLRVDVVYERGRIFGGTGVFLGRLFHAPSVYELNEPIATLFCERMRWPVIGGILCRVVRAMDSRVQRNASLVTITHESMKSVDEVKYHLMSYGVDSRFFSFHERVGEIEKRYGLKGKIVLYVGSFAPWHALKQLLEAQRILEKSNTESTLLMVGEGDQLPFCKQRVQELGLKGVVFTGALVYEDIPQIIATSEVCVALFDRTYSGFRKNSFFYSPLKIHEYQAMGKPIVASDFGNLPVMLDSGKGGVLVNEQDPKSIADAIQKVLHNKKLAGSMGKENRRIAGAHRWDILCKNVLERIASLQQNS